MIGKLSTPNNAETENALMYSKNIEKMWVWGYCCFAYLKMKDTKIEYYPTDIQHTNYVKTSGKKSALYCRAKYCHQGQR